MAESEGGFEPPVQSSSTGIKEQAVKTFGSGKKILPTVHSSTQPQNQNSLGVRPTGDRGEMADAIAQLQNPLPNEARLAQVSANATAKVHAENALKAKEASEIQRQQEQRAVQARQEGIVLLPQIENITTDLRDGRELLSTERVQEIMSQIKSNDALLSLMVTNSEYTQPVLQMIRALQTYDYSTSVEVIQEAKALSNTWVSNNIERISSAVDRTEDPSVLQLTVDLVNTSFGYGSPNNTELDGGKIQFLVDHLETGLSSDNSRRESDPNHTKYKDIVETILKKGSPEQIAVAEQLLLQMSSNPDLRLKTLRIIASLPSMVGVSEGVANSVSEKVLKPTLEQFGLSYADLQSAWILGNVKEKARNITTNMEEVFNLESAHPGICKVLVEDFGVESFARYPKELLVDLYEQRANRDLPYGLCFYPKADSDGAFYGAKGAMGKFYSDLKGLGYGMRLYEVGGKYEIARAFVGSKRKYGTDNKAAFVILAGHGTPDTIAFGKEPKGADDSEGEIKSTNVNSVLHRMDLEGRGAQRMGEFLAPNANIMLVSCSTGRRESGIGGKMSKIYEGTTVTAPKLDTTLKGIEVTKNTEGALQFKVEYGLGVESQMFSQGKHLEQT